MTRSITIVNNSNWDGEDYVLKSNVEFGPGEMEVTLKPGEMRTLTPRKGQEISFDAVDSKEPEPFYKPIIEENRLGRKQILPRVKVSLE